MSTMLSPHSLQPPKTGSSRWSKALPEVPGVDLDDIYDEYKDEEPSPISPENKDLPRLPIPPPPPRSTSMAANAQPFNSSLSPLPTINTAVAPGSTGLPMMAIPRRPVGKQPSRFVQPQPQQQQQQQQQQQEQPHQPEQAQPPSPTQSISSILSAYSKGSSLDDSPIQTSESTHPSLANVSLPPRHEQAPPASSKMQTLISPSSTKPKLPPTLQPHYHVRVAPDPPIKLKTDLLPPPPPTKDFKYGLPASPLPTRPKVTATAAATTSSTTTTAPKATATATLSDLNTSSPPRPQIWRRRSIKADRSLELPDLKLVDSHGSTAASAPVSQQPVTKKPVALQTGQSQIPTQTPVPTAPAVIPAVPSTAPSPNKAVEADSPTMGSGGSKLHKLKDKLHPFHRRGKSSIDTSSDSTGRPGSRRPPTPEYQKQDVKTPIIDSFVSPLSPASSPELLAEDSPDLSKELPKSPPANDNTHHVGHVRTESATSNGPRVELTSPSRKAAEPKSPLRRSLPPLTTNVGSRPSSGSDSPASRAHHSADTPTRFPPRGSSVRSNGSRAFEQQPRHVPEELDPRLVLSSSHGYLYRGRDGTLYPEMKVTRDADPQAAYFPAQTEKPVPLDTIFKAAPLKDSHYNCYQGHRTMNRRSNRNYSLTCQTCEKPDAEDRWVCTFCHLRICESCFATLSGHHKNLNQLMDDISHQAITAA
ncbi:hypothetical protein BGZ63DRAFT_349142 [Mariannaea sp. PMI_226]|nr:hypothetical protein BGZ63DRAFT_349142 [Mariannaea sp. PMI_226]